MQMTLMLVLLLALLFPLLPSCSLPFRKAAQNLLLRRSTPMVNLELRAAFVKSDCVPESSDEGIGR